MLQRENVISDTKKNGLTFDSPFTLLEKPVLHSCDILKIEAMMCVKNRGCHATELLSELR